MDDGTWCCTPDSGSCCGPGSWCCSYAGNHEHEPEEIEEATGIISDKYLQLDQMITSYSAMEPVEVGRASTLRRFLNHPDALTTKGH